MAVPFQVPINDYSKQFVRWNSFYHLVSYIQGSHYSVRISHKVHDHLLTISWVKPHTVFHTIIFFYLKQQNPTGYSSYVVLLRKRSCHQYTSILSASHQVLLIIMAKSVIPSLVPCGTPPQVWRHGDRELPTRTAWVRLVREALIQGYRVWSTFKKHSSWRRMLWSIIWNPFEKSAKICEHSSFLCQNCLVYCME